jgi:RNA polymerase sigma factor (sigma-70 family)
MAEGDERSLVERAKRGDSQAFLELWEGVKHIVAAKAARMLKNPVDAEVVANDTFLKAFKGIQKFRGDAAFSTWVFQIVTYTALDRIRQTPVNLTSIGDTEDFMEGVASRRDNPEAGATRRGGAVDNMPYHQARDREQAAQEDATDFLDGALQEVTPRTRSIIRLRLEEMPLEDIAATLDVSMSVVYTANRDFARVCKKHRKETGRPAPAREST